MYLVVSDSVAPWTAVYQVLLSMEFSRILEWVSISYSKGLPELGMEPGSGRSPGEGNGNSTPVFLPGKLHGQRSLGYSPWGCKRVGHNLATKQQTTRITELHVLA